MDLSYWRDKHPEMVVPGVADSKELADTIHIIERGGIKVALLNYTQHTNGIPLPDSAPWCVKKLHLSDLPGDVKRAREAGATCDRFPSLGYRVCLYSRRDPA